MSIKDAIREYLDGKTDALEAIRTFSGIFDPDYAVQLLAIINMVVRVEQGDMDKEDMEEIIFGDLDA